MRVSLEVCIDSAGGATAAQCAGADRVELCSSLSEGGVTASHGLIKAVKARLTSTKLMVLVRPRGGDFIYTAEEIEVMLLDIQACRQLGCDGIVIGCLTADGDVDEANTRLLVQAAQQQGLDVTFHRAFDMCMDLSLALETLIKLAVTRVLTSGGQLTAVQGTDAIGKLVQQAAGRISIMAAGGVTAANARELVARTGVREIHSSAKQRLCSPTVYRPAHMTLCAAAPPSDYEWNGTDQAAVTALLTALGACEISPSSTTTR